MLEKFKIYVDNNSLFRVDESILVGVSGGIDSVILLHLLKESGNKLFVAHCNFMLRGKESDSDEKFVTDLCNKLNIECFTKSFNTIDFANSNGISLQMAARELRYTWFEELRSELSVDHIAIAHNMNDSNETFLINLTRGTGIGGLTGIKPRSGRVIRPLLFASREMIEHYSTKKKISYREDSSNAETKYTRNKIRHQIIPVLNEINPSADRVISETIARLGEVSIIYNRVIESTKEKLFKKSEGHIEVSIDELLALRPSGAYYYDIFREFGLGPTQVGALTSLLKSESGRQLSGSTHTFYKDRDTLIIRKTNWDSRTRVSIDSEKEFLGGSSFIKAEVITGEEFHPGFESKVAYFDADLVKYPLIIRNWQQGDYFYPYGMKGRKKLSDLFIDLKIPVVLKQSHLILESNNSIIWVIGIRSDNRFKVGKKSSRILKLSV